MIQKRIYVDTSVLGGVFDDEFRKPSQQFFGQVKQGRFTLIVSPVVVREISQAPIEVQEFFEETLVYAELVDVTQEALRLRAAYLREKILPSKYSDDALHVAIASVSMCSMIVSWNFKHIVHYEKIPLYNAVNILNGYGEIAIYSPWEVIHYA